MMSQNFNKSCMLHLFPGLKFLRDHRKEKMMKNIKISLQKCLNLNCQRKIREIKIKKQFWSYCAKKRRVKRISCEFSSSFVVFTSYFPQFYVVLASFKHCSYLDPFGRHVVSTSLFHLQLTLIQLHHCIWFFKRKKTIFLCLFC